MLPRIQLQKPWDQLYRKTVMPTERLLWLLPSAEGPISAMDAPREALAPVIAAAAAHVMPMARVNLRDLGASEDVVAYFIYHESVSHELIYRLDEAGRFAEVAFLDSDGGQLPLAEGDSFQEGAAHAEEAIATADHRHWRLIADREIPTAVAEGDRIQFEDWIQADWSEMVDRIAALNEGKFPYQTTCFGPYMVPVQSTIFPVMPDAQDPDFYFVGRMNASDLDLSDFAFFLFYHPETRTFVQLTQMT